MRAQSGTCGFKVDMYSGNRVLASNTDLITDAGQFSMIESATTETKSIEFELVSAVPMEKDVKQYENGIEPLKCGSSQLVSCPGRM